MVSLSIPSLKLSTMMCMAIDALTLLLTNNILIRPPAVTLSFQVSFVFVRRAWIIGPLVVMDFVLKRFWVSYDTKKLKDSARKVPIKEVVLIRRILHV